jgi:superfamily I DNA and/or RNA helicase
MPLYVSALQPTSFVATTPVVAARRFMSEVYRPDIVIFDEAVHARHSRRVVKPAMFIFVGDHRQTKPFVRCQEALCKQLEVSLLERAAKRGLASSQLLINHRAFANLHAMQSRLYYKDKLVSGNDFADGELPDSVREVREHSTSTRYEESIAGSRALLVSLENSRWESPGNKTSSYNPAHQYWIVPRAKELLS